MSENHLNPDRQPPALSRASALATLKEQQESLQSAMQATESGFQTLGVQMESMSKLTDGIARLAGEMLEATSGSGEKGALQEATHTFTKVFARAQVRQTHYKTILARLREIAGRTAANLTTRAALERVLFDFGPLAMGFRIEIARLGEGDAKRFLALAETITVAQAQGLRIAAGYFTELGGMLRFIAGVQERLAAHSAHLVQNLSNTRHSLDENLACLKKRWSQASEAGAAANLVVRDIVSQIGKIVVAAQYQDIAHQQLEHISTAIDEIRKQFDEPGNHQPAGAAEFAGFVRHAGLVQCQQMDLVADEVDKASKTIVHEMGRILKSAGNLAGGEDLADSSVDQLLEAFQNDVKSMTELDEAGSAISDELAKWIGPAVQSLATFAADMRKHSDHMRFTAVNAQVVASRAHQGQAVMILAKELRLGADSCLAVIDQMSRFVADVNRDLSGDLDHARIAAMEEGRELREDTGAVTGLLKAVQTGVRGHVTDLAALYNQLSQSTQNTLSRIDLQKTVVDPVRKVKSVIEALVDSLEADDSGESDDILDHRLAALRQGYTMESERTAHDAITKGIKNRISPGTPAPVAAAIPAVNGVNSLGDNVELF